jgi:hypothetical protein
MPFDSEKGGEDAEKGGDGWVVRIKLEDFIEY